MSSLSSFAFALLIKQLAFEENHLGFDLPSTEAPGALYSDPFALLTKQLDSPPDAEPSIEALDRGLAVPRTQRANHEDYLCGHRCVPAHLSEAIATNMAAIEPIDHPAVSMSRSLATHRHCAVRALADGGDKLVNDPYRVATSSICTSILRSLENQDILTWWTRRCTHRLHPA